MKTKHLSVFFGAILLGAGSFSAQAAVVDLYGYSLNIDRSISDVVDTYSLLDPLPSGVDASLFDNSTGLGELSITISGLGAHSFDAFFDHEITETGNTYYNESGVAVGIAATGQSWEIDEPGWIDGDIYQNFEASRLDGLIGKSVYGDTFFPDDVSMAMGWDFSLAMNEKAVISLTLSEIMPTSGFYLMQSDSDSNKKIFLSSSLAVSAIPEPSILLLFGVGLAGLAFGTRRRQLK